MGAGRNTTERDAESISDDSRMQWWLCWVFPSDQPPVALTHGLLIGRDAECEVQLQGSGVSRRHVLIHRQGPLFAVKDLGSTNGTFLGGKRVEHAPIVPGGVLRVGQHVGVFIESVEAPSAFRELATGLFGGHGLVAALAAARSAAVSDISIVIVGATGTGKERVARAIHELSGRKGPFHALNCAALPEHLIEAELFGHRKGAFTGAERAGLGHFRAADRGTLFLDEVAELPLHVQAKLLRALQERAVMPIGETELVPIDLRVISAVQRPLSESVAARTFREDLLSRLAGLTIVLPSLRERPADVALLFQHFVSLHSGGRPPQLDVKLVESLCLYDWPQNVRELERLARQLLAVHGLERELRRSDLPPELCSQVPAATPARNSGGLERRDHDAYHLARALRETRYNISAAATSLGFSRQRAHRLLAGQSAEAFVAEHLVAGNSNSDGESL